MRKRTEDWRDLLSAYALAVDTKKVLAGFLATLATVFVMVVATLIYSNFVDQRDPGTPAWAKDLAGLGLVADDRFLLWSFLRGGGLKMLGCFLPLLNPFKAGVFHFGMSVLTYLGLFWAWSGAGGVVSRLTALEYGRDDLPTFEEARAAVRAKRKAYFLAPVMPLAVIVVLSLLNALGGLVASVPVLGRILLVFPGLPLLFATTITIVFLAVFGVLAFGLMMPAVSVGGKDAFESWSTAYAYVLWGLRRFVCYTLLVGAIGVVASVVAWALAELVIYVIYHSVSIGFVGGEDWLCYATDKGMLLAPAGSGLNVILSGVFVALLLLVRAVPVAYAIAYFFTANTIVFLLLRKEQDNIEVEEIYEDSQGEEAGESELVPSEEQVEEGEGEEAPSEEGAEPGDEPDEQKG